MSKAFIKVTLFSAFITITGCLSENNDSSSTSNNSTSNSIVEGRSTALLENKEWYSFFGPLKKATRSESDCTPISAKCLVSSQFILTFRPNGGLDSSLSYYTINDSLALSRKTTMEWSGNFPKSRKILDLIDTSYEQSFFTYQRLTDSSLISFRDTFAPDTIRIHKDSINRNSYITDYIDYKGVWQGEHYKSSQNGIGSGMTVVIQYNSNGQILKHIGTQWHSDTTQIYGGYQIINNSWDKYNNPLSSLMIFKQIYQDSVGTVTTRTDTSYYTYQYEYWK